MEGLNTVLHELNGGYEVIFINDASRDQSAEVLKELRDTHANVTNIDLAENQGQWESTMLGVMCAAGEYIVTIDADLQYNPADILRLYQLLLDKKLLLVYGVPTRMLSGMGGVRNKVQSKILKKSLSSSFKIFHRSVVFDKQNTFLPDRHFECHEKFHVAADKKGWLEVTISTTRRGGFRRNMFRNTNIVLSYLPEYHPRFRHPFLTLGFVFMVAGLFLIMVQSVLNTTAFFILPPFLIGLGAILCAVGVIWQGKHAQIVRNRLRNTTELLKLFSK